MAILFIAGAAAGGAAALGFLAEELVVEAKGQHSKDEYGDDYDGHCVGVAAFDAAPHCDELFCLVTPVVLKDAHIHHGLVLSPKTIMKNRKEFKNVAHKNL